MMSRVDPLVLLRSNCYESGRSDSSAVAPAPLKLATVLLESKYSNADFAILSSLLAAW